MSEHTPTPWRVEQGTDLIWGACSPDDRSSCGMGYSIVEGKAPGWKPYKPSMEEREANAAFIVRAVNAHDALVKALEDISKQHTSEELRAIVAKECAMSEAARSWHSSASLADFEGGYDECVKIARAALAQVKP